MRPGLEQGMLPARGGDGCGRVPGCGPLRLGMLPEAARGRGGRTLSPGGAPACDCRGGGGDVSPRGPSAFREPRGLQCGSPGVGGGPGRPASPDSAVSAGCGRQRWPGP
ncbi:hypothetical protein NN561_008463 [Cricetulus griseus]